MTFDEIKRSLASYRGHLQQGHTYKLRKKIYADLVLTHADKNENRETINTNSKGRISENEAKD